MLANSENSVSFTLEACAGIRKSSARKTDTPDAHEPYGVVKVGSQRPGMDRPFPLDTPRRVVVASRPSCGRSVASGPGVPPKASPKFLFDW